MKSRLDRFVLCKMQEVLLKEMNRGYYENAANVKEFVDLEGNGKFVYMEGNKYFHVNSICVYQNDMFKFNNYYFKVMEEEKSSQDDKKVISLNSKKRTRKRY